MTPFSGHTRAFALLGHPVGHSLSPTMYNAAFSALGMDAVYLCFDVQPSDVLTVLASMPRMGFGGGNVTVPHKETVFRGLSRLDESARLLGAVNTLRFDTEGIAGFNTDGAGFLDACHEAFGDDAIRGRRVFVLGTGGAGRAVALVAAQAGARALALADADAARAQAVAAEVRSVAPAAELSVVTAGRPSVEAARSADLVVQATPVGMKPDDPPPLPPEAFRAGQAVFDLIYMYPETALMKAAAAAGAKTANGLGMLLHQGVRAFEIWEGRRPPVDVMRTALRKAVYG